MSDTFERVRLLIDQRRYELAEQELQKQLAQDPDDAIAYSTLSYCQGKQECYAEALKSAQTGVALAPDMPFTHYHLALVYYWQKQYRALYQSVQDMKTIAPQDPDAYMLEAFYWAHKERGLKMLAAAEAGLQFDPRHVQCQILRVQALLDVDRVPAAEDGAQHLFCQAPDHPQVHALRGWIALRQGQTKRALKDFKEALRLEPDSPWAHEGLMTALRKQNPLNIFHYINPYGGLLFDAQQKQTSYWITATPFVFLIGIGVALSTQNWLIIGWLVAIFFALYLVSWGMAADSKSGAVRGSGAAGLILGAAAAAHAALFFQANEFWLLSSTAGILAYLICRRWGQMGNLEHITCLVMAGCAVVGLLSLSITLAVGPLLFLGQLGDTAVKLAVAGFLTLQIVYCNSFGQ